MILLVVLIQLYNFWYSSEVDFATEPFFAVIFPSASRSLLNPLYGFPPFADNPPEIFCVSSRTCLCTSEPALLRLNPLISSSASFFPCFLAALSIALPENNLSTSTFLKEIPPCAITMNFSSAVAALLILFSRPDKALFARFASASTTISKLSISFSDILFSPTS